MRGCILVGLSTCRHIIGIAQVIIVLAGVLIVLTSSNPVSQLLIIGGVFVAACIVQGLIMLMAYFAGANKVVFEDEPEPDNAGEWQAESFHEGQRGSAH